MISLEEEAVIVVSLRRLATINRIAPKMAGRPKINMRTVSRTIRIAGGTSFLVRKRDTRGIATRITAKGIAAPRYNNAAEPPGIEIFIDPKPSST
jgi:hypothetical protein